MSGSPLVSQLMARLQNGRQQDTPNGSKNGSSLMDFASQKLEELLAKPEIKDGFKSGLQSGADGLQSAKKELTNPAVQKAYDTVMDAMIDRVTKDWAPGEKSALKRTMNTLDTLAGGDGRFNYGDKAQVIAALSKDVPGIMRMAHQEIDRQLPGIGNQLGHRILDNTFKDTPFTKATGSRNGLIQRTRDKRRAMIMGEARKQMEHAIGQALESVNVDPSTASKVDDQPRNLTIAQMTQLSDDLNVLGNRFSHQGNGQRDLNDAGKTVQSLFQRYLSSDPVLRNGIPSPKRPDAILDTTSDLLRGLNLRD